jgi:hypothetical protein
VTTYYAIDHPARRILVRRVDGDVPERYDPATGEWIAKTDLLRYFLDGHEDGAREIDQREREELEVRS